MVSHGDGSDFHHLQGVVGYLIAVRIRMSVFISHHLHKIPSRITYCFLTNTKFVWLFNYHPYPHLWVYEKKPIQNSMFKPFLSAPKHRKVTVVLRCNLRTHIYFWNAGNYLKEQNFNNCSTTTSGSRKRRKAPKHSKWVFIMAAAGMKYNFYICIINRYILCIII